MHIRSGVSPSCSIAHIFPVRPYEDCCSLFVPRHPATKGRVGDVRAAEDAVPLADLMEQALAARETVDLED